ncbi:hypothetical protein OSH26_24140, partial [Mycobacterium ulcerans]
AMDDALETSIERLRDHLRRPHARKRNHLTENAAYTVNQTDPPKLPIWSEICCWLVSIYRYSKCQAGD